MNNLVKPTVDEFDWLVACDYGSNDVSIHYFATETEAKTFAEREIEEYIPNKPKVYVTHVEWQRA